MSSGSSATAVRSPGWARNRLSKVGMAARNLWYSTTRIRRSHRSARPTLVIATVRFVGPSPPSVNAKMPKQLGRPRRSSQRGRGWSRPTLNLSRPGPRGMSPAPGTLPRMQLMQSQFERALSCVEILQSTLQLQRRRRRAAFPCQSLQRCLAPEQRLWSHRRAGRRRMMRYHQSAARSDRSMARRNAIPMQYPMVARSEEGTSRTWPPTVWIIPLAYAEVDPSSPIAISMTSRTLSSVSRRSASDRSDRIAVSELWEAP